MENFSIMPAGRGGLYSVLPLSWHDYKCACFLFALTLLVFSDNDYLYLCSGSDRVNRMTTLAISVFTVLADVQFLVYAAEGAAPGFCK